MPSGRDDRLVAGIVLAAGASVRMGRNKLFFKIDGEPLVRRTVKRTLEAGLDPIIVVVGHEAERTTAALADLTCTTVVNAEYARGVNSSVRAGIRAVPARAAAAVVVLADMPLVTPAMIAAMAARFRRAPVPLVVSQYGEVNAPPTLYSRALFGELLEGEGEGCGKQVVNRHREEAAFLEWPAEALTDFDVPEEYERVKAFIEEGMPLHAR